MKQPILMKDAQVQTPNSKLKAEVRRVKFLASQDVSSFKIGKAYEIPGLKGSVFLINEIAPHPIDRVPCGYGSLISLGSVSPHYVHLHELGKEFIF